MQDYTEEIVGDYLVRTYASGAVEKIRMTAPDAPTEIPAEYTRVLTKLQFLDLFTDQEMVAYTTAARNDPQVEAIKMRFDATSAIDLDDPRTIQGINALEQLGVLPAGRAAEILAARVEVSPAIPLTDPAGGV